MSLTRVLARLLIIGGGVLGWLAVATTAHADDHVSVSLGGLSSSLTAGGRGDSFGVTLRNRLDTELAPVRRVLVVRLDGLGADGVQISRGSDPLPVESAAAGEVRVVDPVSVGLAPEGRRGSTVSTRYEIRFASTAPSGRAEITFQAIMGGQLLGADSDRVTVRGGAAQPTVLPTPEPIPGLASPGPQVSLAPLDDLDNSAGDGGRSGIPVVFYLLGALMVAAGGGILWLLFRQPPVALVAGAGPDADPTGGQPRGDRPFPAADPQPTAVLPVIGGRYAPRHGAPPPPPPPPYGASRPGDDHPGETRSGGWHLGANPGRPRR